MLLEMSDGGQHIHSICVYVFELMFPTRFTNRHGFPYVWTVWTSLAAIYNSLAELQVSFILKYS